MTFDPRENLSENLEIEADAREEIDRCEKCGCLLCVGACDDEPDYDEIDPSGGFDENDYYDIDSYDDSCYDDYYAQYDDDPNPYHGDYSEM